jgi:hypothetical protein
MNEKIPEDVLKYASWYKAAHGYNPFEYYKCPTCGREIPLISIYRCYECRMGFCRECLIAHCEESKQIEKVKEMFVGKKES